MYRKILLGLSNLLALTACFYVFAGRDFFSDVLGFYFIIIIWYSVLFFAFSFIPKKGLRIILKTVAIIAASVLGLISYFGVGLIPATIIYGLVAVFFSEFSLRYLFQKKKLLSYALLLALLVIASVAFYDLIQFNLKVYAVSAYSRTESRRIILEGLNGDSLDEIAKRLVDLEISAKDKCGFHFHPIVIDKCSRGAEGPIWQAINRFDLMNQENFHPTCGLSSHVKYYTGGYSKPGEYHSFDLNGNSQVVKDVCVKRVWADPAF